MKKTLLAVITTLLMVSCSDAGEYKVDGTIDPNIAENGSTVYLNKLSEDMRDLSPIDSTIVKNGKFTFIGNENAPYKLAFVSFKGKKISPALIALEAGTVAVVLNDKTTVGGTPSNDAYQTYMNDRTILEEKAKSHYEEASKPETSPEQKNQLEYEFKILRKDIDKVVFEFTNNNIESDLGIYFMITNSYRFNLGQLKTLLAKVPEEFKSHSAIVSIQEKTTAMDKTKVGETFTDLKGKDLKDKDIALSDFAGKGKYVLVDFWASWCPPCRRDMPILIEAYNRLKNNGKGLTIVGISLDEETSEWQKGVDELKIPWAQISDLKGWSSELSTAYGISSIPHTVLIDPDGKIIERGLGTGETIKKLEELLK